MLWSIVIVALVVAQPKTPFHPTRTRHRVDDLGHREWHRPADWWWSDLPVHSIYIPFNKKPIPRVAEAYAKKGFRCTVLSNVSAIVDDMPAFVKRAAELAVTPITRIDFLKLVALYKYGGFVVDADTEPTVPSSQWRIPAGCELVLGTQHLAKAYRGPRELKKQRGAYDMARANQILAWAFVAREPRSALVLDLLRSASAHILGQRDVHIADTEEIAGSGAIGDWAALQFETAGIDYVAALRGAQTFAVVGGLCVARDQLTDKWIKHKFANSWRTK